ncbi:hypothetical protein B9T19_03805 [Ignatzschineria sp. F8392]|nr:hypothetical protein B9T19_03805 [Ignatzschineria sp. F8392]
MDFLKNLSLIEIVTYVGFIFTVIGLFTIKKIINKKTIQKSNVKNGISVQAGGNIKIGKLNESKSNCKK